MSSKNQTCHSISKTQIKQACRNKYMMNIDFKPEGNSTPKYLAQTLD